MTRLDEVVGVDFVDKPHLILATAVLRLLLAALLEEYLLSRDGCLVDAGWFAIVGICTEDGRSLPFSRQMILLWAVARRSLWDDLLRLCR